MIGRGLEVFARDWAGERQRGGEEMRCMTEALLSRDDES